VESKVGSGLKSFLKGASKKYDLQKQVLGVIDPKLGGAIGKKLKIQCVHNSSVDELTRAIRGWSSPSIQPIIFIYLGSLASITSLIDGLEEGDLNAMTLGLAHSLSRYKLKFSPDKVDTMIVQAIGLLDDLDKVTILFFASSFFSFLIIFQQRN
jgi:nucleolar protein 58